MGSLFISCLEEIVVAGTDQIFRLNWAANGRQSGAATTDYSLFVGDLVEEVYMVQPKDCVYHKYHNYVYGFKKALYR